MTSAEMTRGSLRDDVSGDDEGIAEGLRQQRATRVSLRDDVSER